MPTYPKAKELIFVINSLAANVSYLPLKSKLESWSLKLLEELALEDFRKSIKASLVLRSLVDFGRSIYQIEPINADSVIQELEKLNAAIRQSYSLPDLPDFFSESTNSKNSAEEDGLDATIRQSAIMEKIRQLPNCQLKDLMGSFTDVSERTLRYDLQRLFSQGLIERVGAGPSTYYVIK